MSSSTFLVGGWQEFVLYDPASGDVVVVPDWFGGPPTEQPEYVAVGSGAERRASTRHTFEPQIADAATLTALRAIAAADTRLAALLVGFRQHWVCDETLPVLLAGVARNLGAAAGETLRLALQRRNARITTDNDLLALRSPLLADSGGDTGYRTFGSGTVLLPTTPGGTVTMSANPGENALFYVDLPMPVPGLFARYGGDFDVNSLPASATLELVAWTLQYGTGTGEQETPYDAEVGEGQETAEPIIESGPESVVVQMSSAAAAPLYQAGEGPYWIRLGVRLIATADAASVTFSPPQLVTYSQASGALSAADLQTLLLARTAVPADETAGLPAGYAIAPRSTATITENADGSKTITAPDAAFGPRVGRIGRVIRTDNDL